MRYTRNVDATSPDRYIGPSTSNAVPQAKVTDYLVGAQLEEALATGQDLIVSWPFAEGGISDYTQAEALWCVIHSLTHSASPLMRQPTIFV